MCIDKDGNYPTSCGCDRKIGVYPASFYGVVYGMEVDKLILRIAELETALNWCIEEGGWRMFYHAANVPDVFDTSDIHNVKIRPTMPINATD